MTDPRIPESKQKEAELPDDLDQTPAEARPGGGPTSSAKRPRTIPAHGHSLTRPARDVHPRLLFARLKSL